MFGTSSSVSLFRRTVAARLHSILGHWSCWVRIQLPPDVLWSEIHTYWFPRSQVPNHVLSLSSRRSEKKPTLGETGQELTASHMEQESHAKDAREMLNRRDDVRVFFWPLVFFHYDYWPPTGLSPILGFIVFFIFLYFLFSHFRRKRFFFTMWDSVHSNRLPSITVFCVPWWVWKPP